MLLPLCCSVSVRLPPGAEGMALAAKAAITSAGEGNWSATRAVNLALSISRELPPINFSRFGPKKVQLGSETGSSAVDLSGRTTSEVSGEGLSGKGNWGFASMYPAAVMNRPAPHAATIL